MNEWVLGVKLDGEWEHCKFTSRLEALDTFRDLTLDYKWRVERAVLVKAAHVHRCGPTDFLIQ